MSAPLSIRSVINRLPRVMHRHKLVQLLLAFSPQSRIELVEFNGDARLYADLSDAFPRAYFLAKSYDPEYFRIAAPFLSGGGDYLDLGANAGFTAFGLIPHLRHCAKVTYHLFEANPQLCDLLRRSAALYPDESIRVYPGCIAEKDGESGFQILHGHLGQSYAAAGGNLRVPNILIDDWIKARKISRVPFMKMDLEGSELRALAGMENALSSGIIEALYIEIAASTLGREGASPEDIFALLWKLGFELYFVKSADLNRSSVDSSERCELAVRGGQIRAARLKSYPQGHETDILAVHKKSGIREVRE